MLNISNNKLNDKVSLQEYSAFKKVFVSKHYKVFNRFLGFTFILALIVLLLPWTQNVSGKGYVTTLTPDQRPQTVQSPIPGKIEKWYVKEGDYVKKGDTVLFISEIKNDYLDPNLVGRTNMQRAAKEKSVLSYQEKVKALKNQQIALQKERGLKLAQVENKLKQAYFKVASDSIAFKVAKGNLQIAEKQYQRTVSLQKEGLKAVKDVEEKSLKLQETQSKLIAKENKLLLSRNEIINARIEINRVQAMYADKISKSKSERFTASSNQFNAEAQVSKLENQVANYSIRNSLYYVKAPQDGYINKALRNGIGETFKAGEKLVSITPANYDLAVETYINPIDLPLVHKGASVRIQFDGWPSVFFTGWPNASFGTFAGKIIAIETFISENGKFRVLIAPDNNDVVWPKQMRVGSGAHTIALLNDVPIWYEMWRQLNGFPPDYYTVNEKNNSKKEQK